VKKILVLFVLTWSLLFTSPLYALDAFLAWECNTCVTEKVTGFKVWKKATGVTVWTEVFNIENGTARSTPSKITFVDKTTYGVTAYDANLNESTHATLLYEVKAIKFPTNIRLVLTFE
jgi:hypothetical protein